jgi:hypothetical protein
LRIGELAIRLLIQLVALVFVCWWYIVSHGAEGRMILVIPLFLGIPGLIVSLCVFAPLELIAIHHGSRWIALTLLPFVGAIVPWLLYPMAKNTGNFIAASTMLSGYGFLWGVLWAATRLFYRGDKGAK